MKTNKILYLSLLISTPFLSIYGMEDDSRGLKRAPWGFEQLANDRPDKKQRADEPNQPVANADVVTSPYAQLKESIAQSAKEHEQAIRQHQEELYIEETIKLILDGDVANAKGRVLQLLDEGHPVGEFLNQIPSLFEKRPDIVPLDPNHPDHLTKESPDMQKEIIHRLDDQDKAALACVNKHFNGLMPRYFKKPPFSFEGGKTLSFRNAESYDFKPRWNVGNIIEFSNDENLTDFIPELPIIPMLFQMLFIKKNVKGLSVDGCGKKIDLKLCMAMLNRYPMISSLSLPSIGAAGATELAKALTKIKTLTQLNLEDNFIGDESAIALAQALKTNKTLTLLDLKNNEIEAAGATALAQALATNKTLTQLDLQSNSIGDAGATALANALETNKTLTRLDLQSNSIGDEGATALAQPLKTNKTLTQLDLKSNEIGDDGAIALAQALKQNETLTQLNLYNNSIGDAGATELAQALETNKTLTQLYLSGNSIGSDGVGALVNLKTQKPYLRIQF